VGNRRGVGLGRAQPRRGRSGHRAHVLIVAPHHLNGHGICHGGFIFTLADSAFAFACNSHNRIAVAQHNSISYLSPGKGGETLTAEAREVSLTGRSGLTDVTVTGGDGRIVALFRGASRQIAGTHFPEDT
jgi:acyl-CoA thioesterase